MTNRELLHKKLKEINPLVDLTIACDAYLDTDEKVNIVLNAINNGELKTNDDVCFKFLEIDCGYDVRKK